MLPRDVSTDPDDILSDVPPIREAVRRLRTLTCAETREASALLDERTQRYGKAYRTWVEMFPKRCVDGNTYLLEPSVWRDMCDLWRVLIGIEQFEFFRTRFSERTTDTFTTYAQTMMGAVDGMVEVTMMIDEETEPLNAFAAITGVYRAQAELLWTRAGWRAFADAIGMPPTKAVPEAVREDIMANLIISRLSRRESLLLREVFERIGPMADARAPAGAIPREIFAEAHRSLCERGQEWPSAEAVRKAFERVFDRLQAAAPKIWDLAGLAMRPLPDSDDPPELPDLLLG